MDSTSHFTAYTERKMERTAALARHLSSVLLKEFKPGDDYMEFIYALGFAFSTALDAMITAEHKAEYEEALKNIQPALNLRSEMRMAAGHTVLLIVAQLSASVKEDVCCLLGHFTTTGFQQVEEEGKNK